jgi:uncharacterized protein YecE (DUF72 family)
MQTWLPERPRVGTVGWAVPRAVAERFPAEGTTLQRYAARFDGVEVNSTFYRSHRASTYERWAAATPAHFRFAVKLPRSISHSARLVDAGPLIAAFREEALHLGDKLGPLLVQLPPSLAFSRPVAEPFFAGLRGLWPGSIVCEPRHTSWFEGEADTLLTDHHVGRVAADPAVHPAASVPGGWAGIAYRRLHGSPRMYFSSYGRAQLEALSRAIQADCADERWCVFDNTTLGAAAANALALQSMLLGGDGAASSDGGLP